MQDGCSGSGGESLPDRTSLDGCDRFAPNGIAIRDWRCPSDAWRAIRRPRRLEWTVITEKATKDDRPAPAICGHACFQAGEGRVVAV
jgi:hypothetical protein